MRGVLWTDGNRAPLALLVALVTLATFTAQLDFRAFDDNRLTSWRWAFGPSDFALLVPILAVAIPFAWLAAAMPLAVRTQKAALFAAAFAGAALFWGVPEVIVDAARYIVQAKHLELYGAGFFLAEWGRAIPAWTDLPLVPFLHGLTFAHLGESRLAIQSLTTLSFAGTLLLTWLIGRTLWDDIVGGCAAASLLAMPYLLVQPALILVDVPTMFFLTLATYLMLRAIRDGGAGVLLAAAAAVILAMLSKYSAWLMLSVGAVIVLTHLDRGGATVLRRAALIVLATLPPAGAFVLFKQDVVAAQIGLLWGFQLPGLERWQESHVSTFLFQIHPFVTIAALCAIAVAIVRRDGKFAIVAWMLLLLLALGVKRARYIVIALPMLALMAGYGLRAVADGRIRRFILACAVVSSAVTAVAGYRPLLRSMSAVNLQAAGAYLDRLDGDAVEVHILPQPQTIINPAVALPILDLFTEKRIVLGGAAPSAPPADLIATSPLRFTWEYATPRYLLPGDGMPPASAVAVIVPRADQPLPAHIEERLAGFRDRATFAQSDELFRFQTLVLIYHAPE